jgi:hypothetical protein
MQTITTTADDEIGVDLDNLRPESASATLGTAVPGVRLPSRERDGFAIPQLPESERQAVLKGLGIDMQPADLVSHVRLDMGRACVSGKGYIDLSRFSSVFSDEPRADWRRSLTIDSGAVDIYFSGLTANKQYLISIAVGGSKLISSGAFKVSSSEDFHANFPVSSTVAVQYLYGVIKPASNHCLVRLEPIQLKWLGFYNVELSAF